ncbi:RISC-loading complex subunit tarbp2-like [Babylonia areolata]|uniref:RISC-loading complex subunit tarbp2-like n=1 Tax=Babylonia areolata TaxID=304850 RepID=UPI003FD1629B
MAVPAGKTPISYLQEYCTKRGLTPQYDLLANEGAVHEPTFLMRVTVGDTVANGKGSSKKKAKHCAAQAALNVLLGIENNQPAENEGGKENNGGEDGVGNPIGELQEFTQKKLMKPPIYEFSNEQGPPHNREFVCTIKLGKFVETGSGRSKKAAKRNAAAKMMDHIKNVSGAEGDQAPKVEESDEEEEIPLGFENKGTYTALKNKKRGASTIPEQSRELQLFYENIMQQTGKQLNNTGAGAPASNFCQMLQEIAEVRRFEVTCYDISENTVTGQFQTLIKLTTNPVAVCHGSGSSMEDSRANAAHNALQYLRIMSK